MTRIFFTTAFLLGAIVVAWMALDFVGSDTLALMVTLVIGAVYIIGFIEQLQYRQVTATLKQALDGVGGQVDNLDQWLNRLHDSLQNSVRSRIEGERVALPSPVLTPYLVGLLVMLGLMGTFVGMVITLKGAVIALEGTTELQAIREGLTAPIGGLGLAFGTSVAGVAASAMLGLISTISRRERMFETSRLDAKIATAFRAFSLVHNRQETYKALQAQAQALPQVAERLQAMSLQLETMGTQLSNNLSANQQEFHQAVEERYTQLADTVGEALKASLEKSGQLVVEGVQPVVKATLQAIADETKQTHRQLSDTAEQQLQTIGEQTQRANEQLLQQLEQAEAKRHVQQQTVENAKLDQWQSILQKQQSGLFERVDGLSKNWMDQLSQSVLQQAENAQSVSQEFRSVAESILDRLTEESRQSTQQQNALLDQLQQSAASISQNAENSAEKSIEKIQQLMTASEALVEARIQGEKVWLEQQQASANQIAQSLQDALAQLMQQEQARGDAAVDRLAQLEAKVAEHLSSLGQSLEQPMNRLFETASEAPKAAAEVIEKLRGEISKNIERDNSMLEERRSIMEELNTLLSSIEQTSSGQREAIETLVQESGAMFKEVSRHISEHVSGEINKISDVADQFAGSAIEISSLGESFNVAVQQFSESNQALMENLQRIEESLANTNNRSDEQLAYYVTQAREIIDHSMMSQKEIIQELQHLSRQPDLFAEEVE